ncbi:hypothetical protein J1605_011827 [Eschrichtius robustus]|uniref:Asparaginase n=1 Tax=Eschrichtius robustus TaxID=9764 RepID=A0AB34GKV6_ESCRO|nr:hypothetical protein J1605_011827 [Eschrichtius robustus]
MGGPLAPPSVRHLAFEPQFTATRNAPARCTEIGSPEMARDLSPIPPTRDRTRPAPPPSPLPPPPILGQAPTLRRAPPLPPAALCAPRRLRQSPRSPVPWLTGMARATGPERRLLAIYTGGTIGMRSERGGEWVPASGHRGWGGGRPRAL